MYSLDGEFPLERCQSPRSFRTESQAQDFDENRDSILLAFSKHLLNASPSTNITLCNETSDKHFPSFQTEEYLSLTRAYEQSHTKFLNARRYLNRAEQRLHLLVAQRDENYWDYTSDEYLKLLSDIEKAEEKRESWERRMRIENGVLVGIAMRLGECGRL